MKMHSLHVKIQKLIAQRSYLKQIINFFGIFTRKGRVVTVNKSALYKTDY